MLFVQKLPMYGEQKLSLSDYKFSDFSLNDDTTLRATARMFVDLDLIDKFRIPYEVRALASLLRYTLAALDRLPNQLAFKHVKSLKQL